jgi:hypothetical protein
MQGKQNVIANYRSRYRHAKRKEKGTILNEVQFITGYNRKYALRILNKSQAPQALLTVKGKAVKLKPPKKKPANRTGKKIYTDEVLASLRLIWAFFWYKCGLAVSPAAIDRTLKKDKAALALKGKSLAKPGGLLKHRIPIRTFYTSEERILPGFIGIDPVGLLSATTADRPSPASISSPSPPPMSPQAGYACIPCSTRPTAGPSPPPRTSILL